MSWFCIKSRPIPKGEHRAANNIRLKLPSAWVYLPEIPNDWRYLKNTVKDKIPLFPGYLFVYLREGEDDFRIIKKAPGVAYIVHFSAEPAKLTEADIEAVRQIEAAMQPPPEYKKGEAVRIKGGAMAGYEAVFQARTGRERADVLLVMLGNSQRIRLNLRELEPAV